MRGAALAAALGAAALLPGRPLGVGVPLVAALVAWTVVAARPPLVDGILFGLPALMLASAPAVLDAQWVVALDLAGAWLFASLAVGGPVAFAPIAPFHRLRALPHLAPEVPRALRPAFRGGLLGAVLVLPFGALFWTADAAFAEIARRVPFPSAASLPGRVFTFAVVLLGAVGLALAARRPLGTPSLNRLRKLSVWEWAIPLALLNALFLAFVLVQFTVLFAGHDYVLRTAGVTYAEYARQGFWQLLAAATLTLALVGAAAALTSATTRRERVLRRILLAGLCALTLVVLASAVHRLRLYEDAFGLTRARLGADAFALWLGGLFVLVVAAGAAARFRRHLARAALAGTAAALVTFSLLSPDRLIAERNLERWHGTGRLDVVYLRTLSADAVPVLARLPADLRRQALAPLASRLRGDEPWSSANLSRHRARALLGDLNIGSS